MPVFYGNFFFYSVPRKFLVMPVAFFLINQFLTSLLLSGKICLISLKTKLGKKFICLILNVSLILA